MGNKITRQEGPPIYYSDSDEDFETISNVELIPPIADDIKEEGFFSDSASENSSSSEDTSNEQDASERPRLSTGITREIVAEYNKRFVKNLVNDIIIEATNNIVYEDELSEDEAAFTIVDWLRKSIKNKKEIKLNEREHSLIKAANRLIYWRRKHISNNKSLSLPHGIIIGDEIDCYDSDSGVWREGRIIKQTGKRMVEIHFIGWTNQWNVSIPINSYKIQPKFTKTSSWRETLKAKDLVEVKVYNLEKNKELWYKGYIYSRNGYKVTIYGTMSSGVTLINSIYSELIMPPKTHIRNELQWLPGENSFPWWLELKNGDYVDVQNINGKWCEARVLNCDDISCGSYYSNMNIKINYRRGGLYKDFWLKVNDKCLQPAYTKVKNMRASLKIGDLVEMYVSNNNDWVVGFVIQKYDNVPLQCTSEEKLVFHEESGPYYKFQWALREDCINKFNKYSKPSGTTICCHNSDNISLECNLNRKNWHTYQSYNLKKNTDNFVVGDIVKFNTSREWKRGKIISRADDIIWICPEQNSQLFVKIDLDSNNNQVCKITNGEQFYNNLKENDKVDVLDIPNKFRLTKTVWREGIIVGRRQGPRSCGIPEFKIHYCGYDKEYDKWISVESGRIQPPYSKVKVCQLDMVREENVQKYPLDVYHHRPKVEEKGDETFYNKISHNRIYTYQNEAHTRMIKIKNDCKGGFLTNKHFHPHIEGVVWLLEFMGAKFIPYKSTECRIRAADGNQLAKIYLLLEDFLKNHVLKYLHGAEEQRLNLDLIDKRIRVRWSVWCEWTGDFIEEWFKGFISGYDELSGKHTVIYDDGDLREYTLGTIGYEVLENSEISISQNSDEEKQNLGDIKQRLHTICSQKNRYPCSP